MTAMLNVKALQMFQLRRQLEGEQIVGSTYEGAILQTLCFKAFECLQVHRHDSKVELQGEFTWEGSSLADLEVKLR